MKFKKGEIVRVLLTSELGMIIGEFSDDDSEVCASYERGYQVRMPDYSVHNFYEFELAKREVGDGDV